MSAPEWVILILVLLYVLFLAGITEFLFWNWPSFKRDGPKIPEGPQYAPYAEQMHELVSLCEKQKITEEIWIRSRDGTSLYGRYYEAQPGGPLQLQFHGYRGGPCRDMCGAHKIAREHGMNCILVDMRDHGKSGGQFTTFGIREREDIRAWACYASERFGPDTPIILSGISMGAAAVLMAADAPLPANVVCLIADCPYTSPKDIICGVMKKLHVSFLWPSVWLSARIFARFNITETSALKGIRNTDLPVLLIHGSADRFVPEWMSEALAQAGRNAQLEVYPGGAHGISYLTDPVRYEKMELSFIERSIASWKRGRGEITEKPLSESRKAI
jgi:pimeloyl-ACP methyl ester carboxylesterase